MKRKILFFSILLIFCLSSGFLMALPKVAVLDTILAEGMDDSLAVPITDKVMEELVNSGKYVVLDRNFINEVLKEKEFQLSGIVKNEDIKKAGEYLGADYVVVARTSIVGDFFFVSARMIDVKTGAIVAQTSQEQRWDVSTLFQAASKVGNKLAGGKGDVTGSPTNDKEARAQELVKGKQTTATTSTTASTATTKAQTTANEQKTVTTEKEENITVKTQKKIENKPDRFRDFKKNAMGIKLGITSSQIVGTEYPSYWENEQTSHAGMVAGIYLENGISRFLSLGLEVDYIQKGTEVTGFDLNVMEDFTESWSFSYVQVPILLKLRIPFSSRVGMHLGAGPFLAYALTATMASEYDSFSTDIDFLDDSNSDSFNKFDYGIATNFDVYFPLGHSLQMLLGLDIYISINSFLSDSLNDSFLSITGYNIYGINLATTFYAGIGFSY